MPKLQKIYRILRNRRDESVDLAMAEALPSADRVARRLIVLSLLERGTEVGMLAIVRQFDRLERDLQVVVTEHTQELDTALRAAAVDPIAETRLNAIDIIVRSGGYRLAYLVAAQLHESDARLTRQAAASLLEMAESVAHDRRAGVAAVRRIQWVAGAITEACSCYHQHKRHDVLLAAATLAPRRFDRLTSYLVNRRMAAHTGATEMIRRADRPVVNRAMLSYASIPELEPVVVESLRQPAVARHLSDLMSLSHLLAAPAIGAMLRKITRADHLVPPSAMLRTLRPATLRQAVRWIANLYVPAPTKAAALGEVAATDDPLARLSALRAMVAIHDESTSVAIAALCHDADAVIARIALRELVRRKWTGLTALLMRLVTSPHPDVRRIAERHLIPVGFERFWDHWERMDPAHRIEAGRALLKVDPVFNRQLADKMASRNSDDRLKSVMIVRALRLETYFEPQMLRMSDDPDARVASAAVRGVGGLGSTGRATRTLRKAMEHSDDRVRANAVEAAEQSGAVEACGDLLERLAHESGNRSRANAIKAMLERPVGEALPALNSMLVHTDPRHRISALWVVQQLAVADVARRVATLARADTDTRVKRRAIEVFRDIAESYLEQMQAERADESEATAEKGGAA